MYIKEICIRNFRLFSPGKDFKISDLNVPDGETEGSGLNVFVGENGCGKSTLLEAFALPLLDYKARDARVDSFNELDEPIKINLYSSADFKVKKSMPKGDFPAKGLSFEARIRARGDHLSSIIVSDQKYINTNKEDVKPNSPDLRVSVYNPFFGKRYNENEVLLLDKNRIFQTRSGKYSRTYFDRLTEGLGWQYLKGRNKKLEDLSGKLKETIVSEEDETFLREIAERFEKISGQAVQLEVINNFTPFNQAFLATKNDSFQQIGVPHLGSGYEMIFSILYSLSYAWEKKKKMILLIDEPELHLHPKLQGRLVDLLLEYSKDAQILLASHSPLLIKQLSKNTNVKVCILERKGEGGQTEPSVQKLEKRALSPSSANEMNFLAFGLASEEYHDELYEGLKGKHREHKGYEEFDKAFFTKKESEPGKHPWMRSENRVSIHTYIRNQIHHPNEYVKLEYEMMEKSIITMRSYYLT